MLLDALMERLPPAAGLAPIDLSLGSPQNPPPDFVLDVLAQSRALFGSYAPTGGTAEFREAAAG